MGRVDCRYQGPGLWAREGYFLMGRISILQNEELNGQLVVMVAQPVNVLNCP